MLNWVPHRQLRASKSISSLSVNSDGLSAATSWDGTICIADVCPTNTSNPYFMFQASRPLIAHVWRDRSSLCFGGGENRICLADINYSSNTAYTYDLHPTEDAVLGLCSHTSHSVMGITRGSLFITDFRSKDLIRRDNGNGGGVAIDSLGNYVCAVTNRSSCVYDDRFTKNPVYRKITFPATVPLQVKWLESQIYAVSDSQSHVQVNSMKASRPSYVFNTNRVGPHKQARPVYALARGQFPGKLITGGGDHSIYEWDYHHRKLLRKTSFPAACTVIAYAPDSSKVAVALSNDEWSTMPSKYSEFNKARVMVACLT